MKTLSYHRLFARANQLADRLIAWRRHLHMYPEPSLQEHDTAAFVAARLQELGLDRVRTGVGGTGVVGLIRGRPGKCVGLRADMDALELQEEHKVAYRSRRPGLMHACGHDGHVACLLGCAAILTEVRDRLPGTVKLIFQPGEEGEGGARLMIEDGVLARPKLSAVVALHVDIDVAAGKIGIRRGYDTAQTDDIHLVIQGKTAHAAQPERGVDAIAVTSQALIAIQQFIARHVNPLDRKLVTFGTIHGGTRRNILADQVELQGTIRTLEPDSRKAILKFLSRDLRKLVKAMGARMKVQITEGYPPLINDNRVVEVISQVAIDILGRHNLVEVPQPVLGGEDFAYFGLAGLPTAMLRLGIRDEEKGFVSPGHSSTFDFDDRRILPIGAAIMAASAIRLLFYEPPEGLEPCMLR